MTERLTPLEVSTLALDTAHTPAHVATVDIFDAGSDGLDFAALTRLIEERIAFVPRYRERIRAVPARLAGPVWVEDDAFDLSYHVRRSGLPRPGSMDQLREFVGRVCARRLDRSRPLWEMWLVEGLEGDRVALVTKSHLSMVDGLDTVDIGQVLLDSSADTHSATPAAWHPMPEPSGTDLLIGAAIEAAQDPARAVTNAQYTITGALGVALAVGEAVGGLAGIAVGELAATALRGGRPPTVSPLAGVVSEQRRFATVSCELADLRSVRAAHDQTINDVVLAMIAGGLRAWLLTRGESVSPAFSLTALVPMSVTDDDGEPTSLGSQVAPYLMTLPVGEPNALMRLHQVSYGTQAHKDTGRSVAARTIADIAGFAPSTLHTLGVRVAGEVIRRQHDLVITNAPGPQFPLYAAGAEMVASYPVLPLGPGHLLAIGVTSYNGQVTFGLTGDRDALSDLDVLAQCLEDALDELLDTTVRSADQRQPTRKASAAATAKAEAKAAAREQAREQARAEARALAVKRAEAARRAVAKAARRRTS